MNKLQSNFSQNTKRYINENVSENIVCETAAILSRENELKDKGFRLGPNIKVWNRYLVYEYPL